MAAASGKALTPKEAEQRIGRIRAKADETMKAALVAAVKVVEPAARRNLAGEPVPNSQGMIDVRAGMADPSILLDYKRYPWAAGAEAGAKRYRQFRRYVGFGEQGYIVGAAIRETDEVSSRAAKAILDDLAKEELA